MQWIAIHEDVLGTKLRGLWKNIGTSEAEALGILAILWLWGRRNTDATGYLKNTERSDIADAIRGSLSKHLDANAVVDALIDEGWIDDIDGELVLHDWSNWQSYWYKYLEKKEKDAERKRASRGKKEEEQEKTPEKPKKPKKPKASEPDKVKYAEYVSMLPEEYQKLITTYGEQFTVKCVEVLDNYKGAKGTKYKSDYRAILNWVTNKVEREFPHLKLNNAKIEGNPFSSFKGGQ